MGQEDYFTTRELELRYQYSGGLQTYANGQKAYGQKAGFGGDYYIRNTNPNYPEYEWKWINGDPKPTPTPWEEFQNWKYQMQKNIHDWLWQEGKYAPHYKDFSYNNWFCPPAHASEKFEDDFNQAESTPHQVPLPDPLILDLDGDGLETTTLLDGVYFDMNNNNLSELMTWVGADDGLLAIELNNDGVICNGTEIIQDFQALATYDSNSDGKIDTNDDLFDEILVFKGDGRLLTLTEAGIKSISLTYSNTRTLGSQF